MTLGGGFRSSFVSDWEYRVLEALGAGALTLVTVCARTGLARDNAQGTLQMLIEREPPFVALRPSGRWQVTADGWEAVLARARAVDAGDDDRGST